MRQLLWGWVWVPLIKVSTRITRWEGNLAQKNNATQIGNDEIEILLQMNISSEIFAYNFYGLGLKRTQSQFELNARKIPNSTAIECQSY